jgi:hypothetical protein
MVMVSALGKDSPFTSKQVFFQRKASSSTPRKGTSIDFPLNGERKRAPLGLWESTTVENISYGSSSIGKRTPTKEFQF